MTQSERIATLEPVTRGLCEQFLSVCAQNAVGVRVTQALRTMDEQASLWAQGRTVPGKIVTRAKPGQSPHNFGMAFDICFSGAIPYPDAEGPWEQVGAYGKGVGLDWGGDFKSIKDRPHFERPDWRSASEGGGAA
jgi:peptidoglycan L-alanyl-D-glutamate endopeptidase CwlK